jgi:hypothetical protein
LRFYWRVNKTHLEQKLTKKTKIDMIQKNSLKTLRYLSCLLFLLANFQFHFAGLFPESPYRFGDYTCDPNAYYIILGQIDVLRNELIKRSVEKNLDLDYQAYRQAQTMILEKADVNKDKFISTAEIYNLDMQEFKSATLKRPDKTAPADDQVQPKRSESQSALPRTDTDAK